MSKYTVLGFQNSGQAAVKLLLKHNHNVFVSQNTPFDKQQIQLLKKLNIDYEDKHTDRVLNSDYIIISPGISFDIPIIKKAINKHIKILPEIELAYHYINSKIIAITGTNGKSTTTYLLYQILKENNKNVIYGGNISPGTALSEIALNNNYDYIVCEVSSFQLEHINSFKPFISIITNISEDHLNRHIEMKNYIKAKLNIIKNHNSNDLIILNRDCKILKNIKIENKKIYVSINEESEVYYKNSEIHINFNSINRIINIQNFNLPGKHNIYNLMQALACAIMIDEDINIDNIIDKFKSLPHRMEFLGNIKTHPVYNNSMCTNPIAFKESVNAMPKNQTVILGGKDKGSNIDIIINTIINNTKNAILIGESRYKLFKELDKKNYTNKFIANSLKQAIELAFEKSNKNEIINFSPGFASFDMFENFAHRGEQFKILIKELYERR